MITALRNLLDRFTPSRIILNNCIELIQREEVGLKKYGVSLTDAPLTHEQVLQHLLEEQLDAANYTRKALMTASQAHLDYTLLRTELERFIDKRRHASKYDAETCPNWAADDATGKMEDELKRLLHQFDSAKVLRDLRR